MKTIFILASAIFLYWKVSAQNCTTLGQNPATAFPVCGTDTFSQSTVPYCGGKSIPGPCSRDGLSDLNPFWYKFTCFAGGTLGFVITPNDLDDDYDWQIFDITGHAPNDVYTDASLFVSCNWSGNTGLTGATPSGTALANCAGYAYPTFGSMPVLKAGHDYILLISHFTTFTPSQNGYKLSFGGGTASITDPLPPALKNGFASCDATEITVTLNKKMRCSSLSSNGSEFMISAPGFSIVSAIATSCATGFDMEQLTLTVDKPLSPGQYTLTIKNGTDGNTLLDNCNTSIAVGISVPVEVFPVQPTLMDSLTTPTCAPESLELVFKKEILCSSISPDGSDFLVTGPSGVTVSSAAGMCQSGSAGVILIRLSGPVVKGGTYRLTLVKGSDGNTLLDLCSKETPAGSYLSFTVKDTVSADFSYMVAQGCTSNKVSFFTNGNNGVNKWFWNLGYAGNSSLQNPVTMYNTFGNKEISLTISNDFCSDSITKVITLGDEVTAAFDVTNTLCPEDSALFVNNSKGNIVSYLWDFGDGTQSSAQIPSAKYYSSAGLEKVYPVRLIVKNSIGCSDTAARNIRLLKSCYIAVPNAFTPNGDGVNDFLSPLNAFKADNLDFKVYNRIGQLVFHTTDWTMKWDGKIKGEPQDSGLFVWMLSFINRDTGEKVFQKGSSALLR
ncbi:MAG: PKD domain-containing protein [Ginsengibacter sp.]